MTILEAFALLGGVGLFLFGMSIMSTGLRNAAGDKLKTILEKATTNRLFSVAVGILVTLLIQSSSATDMMVISFVNSGLMTLAQAIGVIMGANIGTTITAQITAFNLSAYAPFILFIGAVMYLFLKKNTMRHIGSIIMGFGMLFVGIGNIKAAIAPLSGSPAFISFLGTLSNPAIAVLFGVLFTALLQSSSSSVVIFQAFAMQGLLSYEMTVYLVIGAAIGSVMPNILASLTTNRNGKRTACLNLLFNLIRAAIMILLINLFPPFLEFIKGLTPDSIGRQVANTHTIFAILAVLIELPFANKIVDLSQKIIPMLPEETRKIEDRKLHYMVNSESVMPSVAVQQAHMEVTRMGVIAVDNLKAALDGFFTKDNKAAEEIADSVRETEETVDYLTDLISKQLIVLRGMDQTEENGRKLSKLTLAASDIERISDYALNIAEYDEKIRQGKAAISDIGMAELKEMAEAAYKSVEVSMEIFASEDASRIPEASALEQAVDDLQEKTINSHVERLMHVQCDPMGGVIFVDFCSDLERCSDHAFNLAEVFLPDAG